MANPPITVGELVDVPAPLSRVLSPWAQEVSNRIVHRFATVAARDAAWPAATAGTGALCVTTADGRLWRSTGAVWVFAGNTTTAGRPGFDLRRAAALAVANGATVTIAWDTKTADPDGWAPTLPTITCPAAWAGAYQFSCFLQWSATFSSMAYLRLNVGGLAFVASPGGAFGTAAISVRADVAAAEAISLDAFQNSGGSINISNARLSATWLGR